MGTGAGPVRVSRAQRSLPHFCRAFCTVHTCTNAHLGVARASMFFRTFAAATCTYNSWTVLHILSCVRTRDAQWVSGLGVVGCLALLFALCLQPLVCWVGFLRERASVKSIIIIPYPFSWTACSAMQCLPRAVQLTSTK